jgi:hypothetical protein
MSLFDDFPDLLSPSETTPESAPAAAAAASASEVELAAVIPIVQLAPPAQIAPIANIPPALPEAEWKKLLDIKDDKVDSTLNNARVYLTHHPELRGFIRWNEYTKKIDVLDGPLRKLVGKDPRAEDIVAHTQDYLEHKHGIKISFSDLSRRIVSVAREFKYDPLIEHLVALANKWDGLGRIEELFITYFGAGRIAGAEPTEEERTRLGHLRRIGKRWMLGAVERALRPGCKVDNVLVLEGVQGARKTSALEALGGAFYCSTQIILGDKDSKMIASSNWLIDLPDTNFMKRTNRGFVTQRVDTYRPPFGAAVEHTPRRCVLVGSMNPEQGDSFQYFEEEERRYWPVRVGKLDLKSLMRDRDQLWGEAAYLVLASATCPACKASDDTVYGQTARCEFHRWWLNDAEEKIALAETADRVHDVPWKLRIQQWWLNMEPKDRPEHFTVEDVAVQALNIAEDKVAGFRGIETTVGLAVRSLGFRKKRITIDGAQHWVYKPNDLLAKTPRSAKTTVNYSSLASVLEFQLDPKNKK